MHRGAHSPYKMKHVWLPPPPPRTFSGDRVIIRRPESRWVPEVSLCAHLHATTRGPQQRRQ
jgi:hypothetical protein